MVEEEYLDLVDANDQKIGTIGRSESSTLHDNEGRYVRASYGFIQNSDGKLWIPRRTADKRIAPNGLDMAMAEHMGVDESYLEAAIRGFQEEPGLTIQPSDLQLLVFFRHSPFCHILVRTIYTWLMRCRITIQRIFQRLTG